MSGPSAILNVPAFLSLPISATALVLLLASLISAITFYLTFKTRSPENGFSQLIVWVTFYIFIHATVIFFAEIWKPEIYWRDRVAPFSLMYGPFLYFGTISVKKDRLTLWVILLHSIPFIGYFIYFILFTTGIIKNTPDNEHLLRDHIVVLNPISFALYTVLAFIEGRSILFGKFKGRALLFIFSRGLMVFAMMMSLTIAFSDRLDGSNEAAELVRMTMYICVLLCTLAILNYTVNRLIAKRRNADLPKANDEAPSQPKYERSSLSIEQLKDYKSRLDHAMEKEKMFLKKNLSLTDLAHHLKVPNHHLTQVFSMQAGQTFYQYVNHFRIEYACKLIKTYPSGLSMEKLAEESGFNSKVSFNRHFKEQMNCTPSAYRSSLK